MNEGGKELGTMNRRKELGRVNKGGKEIGRIEERGKEEGKRLAVNQSVVLSFRRCVTSPVRPSEVFK